MSPTAAEVQAALDVLRAAGWNVQESTGYGHLTAGLLMSSYMGDGVRHVATFARQPWRPEPFDSGATS